MPKYETIRRVRHSAEEMFNLVADVDSYPAFLPMCEALIVRQRKEREGATLLVADMTVGYRMIRETFATQVLLRPGDRAIDVKYLEGPFRRLDNRWRFEPTGDGSACDVNFFIDYEFKSRALGLVMGSMFDMAFRKFSEAFEKRADKVYGTGA